jgi:hypothetical protein
LPTGRDAPDEGPHGFLMWCGCLYWMVPDISAFERHEHSSLNERPIRNRATQKPMSECPGYHNKQLEVTESTRSCDRNPPQTQHHRDRKFSPSL